MKPLKVKLGEKLYTSCKITAWMAREAIAIHKDALSLARRGKEAHESGSAEEAAELLLDLMDDIATRKANLICEAYGNKFTADELERALSREETEVQIESIMSGVGAILTKN